MNNGCSTWIYGSTISKNNAGGDYADYAGGGGIYCYQSLLMLGNVSTAPSITNNTAKNGLGGGVLFVGYKSHTGNISRFVALDGTKISNNSAYYGGGMYVKDIDNSYPSYKDETLLIPHDNAEGDLFILKGITMEENTGAYSGSEYGSMMYLYDTVGLTLSGDTCLKGDISFNFTWLMKTDNIQYALFYTYTASMQTKYLPTWKNETINNIYMYPRGSLATDETVWILQITSTNASSYITTLRQYFWTGRSGYVIRDGTGGDYAGVCMRKN